MSEETKLAVKQFMMATNRPWNATDVANNFQNQHTKSAVAKALDELVANGEVTEKLNGKQKIYYISQEHFVVHEIASKQLDEKIQKHRSNIEELKVSIAEKKEKLESLNSRASVAEMRAELEPLRTEVARLRDTVRVTEERFDSAATENSAEIKKQHKKLVTEWKKRKRMANEMIDAITENYSKGKKAFMEEVGIETDESVNVSVPN